MLLKEATHYFASFVPTFGATAPLLEQGALVEQIPPLPKGGFIPLTLISPARGEKIQTLIPLAPFKKGGIRAWHLTPTEILM